MTARRNGGRLSPPALRHQALSLARLLFALSATGLGDAALAGDDPNPYFVGVSESITHDSNVYRVPSNARGDNYTSTGLQGGIDQPFGSQRFYATGNARKNRFSTLTVLDNTSYGFDAGLDWITVGALSGTVKVNQNQSLATYGTTNQLVLTSRNIQQLRQVDAQVQWGLPDAVLSVESGLMRQSVRYSAPEYAQYETDQTVVHLGLKARPNGVVTLGAALRRTLGAYPELQLPDGSTDRYRRNDIDFTVAWFASGSSTLNGRLSLGHQRYNDAVAQRASSTTGSLQWLYAPVGKLSFDTSIIRDTGQNTTFQTLSVKGATASLSGDDSELTTTLALNAAYAMTGKIGLNVAVHLNRRSLVNATVFSNGLAVPPALGSDRIHTFKVGLTYLPTNSLSVACEVGRDNRSVADGTPAYLSYPYAARTATCSAQFNLQ